MKNGGTHKILFRINSFKKEYKDEYTGDILPLDLVRRAMIEELFAAGKPGARFRAQIQFFDDSARIVATPGAEFDLWLGRTVGRGVVEEVVQEF